MARGRVTVIAEARWRRDRMDVSYLRAIEDFKMPALRQAKLKVTRDVRIVLGETMLGKGRALMGRYG